MAAGTGTLHSLLSPLTGADAAARVLEILAIDPELSGFQARSRTGGHATRAQVAMALNAALFLDLLDRVPTAARYVARVREGGDRIVFDHGALRTIDGPTGALPSGHAAFLRFLAPLGYEVRGTYPLPALTMTGRAFVHADMPEAIPQFFVSELHLSELPEAAQAAAAAIFASATDPLGDAEWQALDVLAREGACTLAQAVTILQGALRAFKRRHAPPALADYEALLQHSKEGAWIATEGNAFNHATTRVPAVETHADELKAAGFPLKPAVEISRNGRVRQTAILADRVARAFRLADGSEILREVPGSFFEFISRDIDPATGRLDLTFDSGNATGIFAVTRDRA
ncbi:2-oxoadipate dioxygenase/decarboxylase family protein [Novosphingobium soli]|uniref:2-oxoadipate dioxygenase/decarboxylase n=1 Tax=Novosphingobium soli TaxID=574956 RepID=A0ABV6CPK3_9SPHN